MVAVRKGEGGADCICRLGCEIELAGEHRVKAIGKSISASEAFKG